MPKKQLFTCVQIILLLVCGALIFSACQFSLALGNSTPTGTPTPSPTVTPTPAPLGSSENPYFIGFDTSLDPQGANQAARDNLAADLADLTGYTVQAQNFSTSQELYQAFVDGNIQITWFNPLTYLYIQQQNFGSVGLLTNHFGTYFYGTQFLANVESGFVSFFDPNSNLSTASAEEALAQLDGKRPCWVDPGSTSGYILPLGILEKYHIYTQTGAILQNHTSVVRALYIKEICDFGATFSISGDPRTSSVITDDLPDASGRVMIVWQSPADIPNMNLTYHVSLTDEVRQTFSDAFLAWIKNDEAKSTLSAALDQYEVQDLRIVDDSVYDPLREAVDLSGTDVSIWIGR